jgi:hypothetical protein
MTRTCFINEIHFKRIRTFLLDTEGIPDDLKQIAKKMKNQSKRLKNEYQQKAKDTFQQNMDDIRQRDAVTASRHEINILNRLKVAIYNYKKARVVNSLSIPVATPVATPVADHIEPPPPPPPRPPPRPLYPPPTPPQPIIYDIGDEWDSSDSDGEDLDGLDDDEPPPQPTIYDSGDDSDDEPIANLLSRGQIDPGPHDYSICGARCASGTREEVGRCTNPTTSMETDQLGCRIGVCRLHKRAIDTAMTKYFGWDRSMGHLYGWWNSTDTIRQRNRNAVIQSGYQGARRKPKWRKTRRFRGQLRGHGSVYNGVRMGSA